MEENISIEKNRDSSGESKKRGKRKSAQLSREEMFGIIKEFKSSGQTRQKFCQERGYPLSNFYYWQDKYHKAFPEEDDKKVKAGLKGSTVRTKKSQGAKTAKTAKTGSMAKSKKGALSAEKKPTAPVIFDAIEIVAGSGRRVRPKKASAVKIKAKDKVAVAGTSDSLPAPSGDQLKKVKRPVKISENLPVQKLSGPIMQIRYPNGVRINLPADTDLSRIKELLSI